MSYCADTENKLSDDAQNKSAVASAGSNNDNNNPAMQQHGAGNNIQITNNQLK